MSTKTGVILAAGKGSRLSSVTRAVPKELLTIGDVPIIEHSVSIMKDAGVKKLIVVVGYHKKAIIDYNRIILVITPKRINLSALSNNSIFN